MDNHANGDGPAESPAKRQRVEDERLGASSPPSDGDFLKELSQTTKEAVVCLTEALTVDQVRQLDACAWAAHKKGCANSKWLRETLRRLGVQDALGQNMAEALQLEVGVPIPRITNLIKQLKDPNGRRDMDDDDDEVSEDGLFGTRPEADGTRSPSPGASQDSTASRARQAASSSMWRKENLPPPLDHELEFLVQDPTSYKQGASIHSHCQTVHGSFTFRLLVFPMGTDSTNPPNQLAAFVEAVPPKGCEEVRWAFEGVRYQIAVVNWKDYKKSQVQNDIFTFTRENTDRGWHKGFVKAAQMTTENGWLNEDGALCIRACCSSRRAMIQQSNRKAVGYVGLKNHGATCYMNCLLQTLFCLGHFRHVTYSIDFPEAEQTQAVVSSNDISDDLGDDDRPALPLLVSLQNLFYRLQTSEAPVSCRELMRSFGWDTADAFMQHDAQELNRLLCDRLEEQMKGTATDGEIKRLFEGEFENYIECIDVDYKSQRDETFYDLQLNLRNDAGKDITSLEESLRDFISEEVLEGDNAYDAGSEHGKQRARKGIRFKRFPPVLYIQLKRFMFDPERMDMNKLNGKMEFPRILDLEAFAPGSGQYMLHTVIVHSGGVSSGHYYAFVRMPDGESGKSQWVKFDDECVTYCSEQAAIEDNFGGEDLQVWDYFQLSPRDIEQRGAPMHPRIHNAYMLSYVRMDKAQELLAPPVINGQEQKYALMVQRCQREAQLQEERRRARYEQMMRVEVKLVLERDVMKMQGFWTHTDVPSFRSLKASREQSAEELHREIKEILQVPTDHMSLFVLAIRKTRQMRFRQLKLHEDLKSLLPLCSLTNSSEQQIMVLAMVSRGYDPHTLEYVAAPDDDSVPHELYKWDDAIVLLLVKYFCPQKQIIVTLGIYYARISDTLQAMTTEPENWLKSRLQPYIDRGEVAPLPDGAYWLCWEEYGKLPKDVALRTADLSLKDNGFFSGDIVIWQPVVPAPIPIGPQPPAGDGDSDKEADEVNAFAQASSDEDDTVVRFGGTMTVSQYAKLLTNRIKVSLRQFAPEAPWVPKGLLAHSNWTQPIPPGIIASVPTEEGHLELSTSKSSTAPGEVAIQEITADARSTLGRLALSAAGALNLPEGHRLWLFLHGAPSAWPHGPFARTDGGSMREGVRTIGDELRNERLSRPKQYLTLTAVSLPPAPAGHRPIAIHFFDSSVCEVGACILHVKDPSLEDDDRGDLPETGRPDVNPKEVLELARQYLLDAKGDDGEQLRRRFASRRESDQAAAAAEAPTLPPLRLLEVCTGRIRSVCRQRSRPADDEEGPIPLPCWPGRGENFFYDALRVEPDWECEGEEAAQLVEVFTADLASDNPFGHPFLIKVPQGKEVKNVVADVQDKIGISGIEMKQMGCRCLMAEGENSQSTRKLVELQDDMTWPTERSEQPAAGQLAEWSPANAALCIERPHPMDVGRMIMHQRALQNKGLTIRAG
eukprot:gb/GFBE01023649.1/.p1 GENE.gb/GFBE01023649.1/~~gb/GFBE01023649.1/.p1  ORF type:complete len:1458 (+),score=331.24 gb/GFBE01023649.1/:1-4374(+)